jgi:cation diffusion facilitator CzcD-associated flavoprotein CzcO
MRSTVKDPKVQAALMPDYPIGGKRILISDDYYPALNRDNVELITSGIDRITNDAVATKDGRTSGGRDRLRHRIRVNRLSRADEYRRPRRSSLEP